MRPIYYLAYIDAILTTYTRIKPTRRKSPVLGGADTQSCGRPIEQTFGKRNNFVFRRIGPNTTRGSAHTRVWEMARYQDTTKGRDRQLVTSISIATSHPRNFPNWDVWP